MRAPILRGRGLFLVAMLLAVHAHQTRPPVLRRRAALSAAASSATTFTFGPYLPRAHAFEAAAPRIGSPFDWSAAWGRSTGSVGAPPKQRGLTPEKVAQILQNDLADSKYVLTGSLTPSIFSDDCHFEDPNNAVDGLAKYVEALGFLFDPAQSELTLLDIHVGADGNTIEADYVASGVLKLPWHPLIRPWQGHIVYTLGKDGLVASQVDVWNITRIDAIRQTFTPGTRAGV